MHDIGKIYNRFTIDLFVLVQLLVQFIFSLQCGKKREKMYRAEKLIKKRSRSNAILSKVIDIDYEGRMECFNCANMQRETRPIS